MTLCCEQDDRRRLVRRRPGWNGLDFVELGANETTLRAYFLGKLPAELAEPGPDLARFLALEGGVRITGIAITDVEPVADPDPDQDDHLLIRLDRGGDFSAYTLRLVGIEKMDPRYATASFHFRIDCPTDLDCAPATDCPPAVFAEPDISYLAKDYASFRQLLLDRLALLMPDWRERHVPDLGLTLVELLAYQGDMLSYYQDSVATEATLDTARLRISVRRHARLVDYTLHEGCNARAFVCVETDTDLTLDASRVSFISGLNDRPRPNLLTWDDLREVPSDAYIVFEPLAATAINLRAAHNLIRFHTFGDTLCHLERGATSAALLNTGLRLIAGDVLILEEVRDPRTGQPADANPARRHAVRLTSVTKRIDPIPRDANGHPPHYLDVTWAAEDALPFSLCLSAIGNAPDCRFIPDISVARGNVVLVDHGRTVGPEDLGTVPTLGTEADCQCADSPGAVAVIPGRFAPVLSRTGLTWRAPPDPAASARGLFAQDPCAAFPCLRVASAPDLAWQPRPDLIDSLAADPHLVVETDNDGNAHLRFGDGRLGLRPPAGARFAATYRVGNGPAGNVGPESITRLVLAGEKLTGVALTIRNPLPAQGGRAAETIAQARLLAPHAFRKRLARAITAEDYATLAGQDPHVQRAAARLVWTGSWYEADVAIDPLAAMPPDPDLLDDIAHRLERYRRIGHDLHVQPARAVALDLAIEACALPGHKRADVKSALLAAFGTGPLPDGTLGFFHPDALTFGEGIPLSWIIARAHAVAGVECVTVTRLQRLFEPANGELETGILSLAAGEIARLDNDPNRPERGQLHVTVMGGH